VTALMKKYEIKCPIFKKHFKAWNFSKVIKGRCRDLKDNSTPVFKVSSTAELTLCDI